MSVEVNSGMRKDRSIRSAIRLNAVIVVGFAVGLALFILVGTQRLRTEASHISHLDAEAAELAEISRSVEAAVRLCTEGLAFKSDAVHAEVLGKCQELQVAFETFMALALEHDHEGELGAAAAMLPEFPPLVAAIRSDMITFLSYLRESRFDDAATFHHERLRYLTDRVSSFVSDLSSAVSTARQSASQRAEFISSLAVHVSVFAALVLAFIVILIGGAVSRLVLAPISAIEDAVTNTQPGRLGGTISRSGVVEFQALTDRFNEMSTRLDASERELHGKALTLEEQKVELEWANQSKTEFLAVASHELKTPVTNVRSFAEILADFSAGESTETRQEFVDIIHSEAIRLSLLVENLLDLARIDSGVMAFEPERLELRDLIQRSVAAVRGTATEKEIEFRIQTPEAEACYLGDEDGLLRVLINLIGNAVKFSPKGATISVTLEVAEGGFEISVADRGPGVPDTLDKTRIFERFVQTSDHLTDRPQGTGLGLAICRELVELHGGRVECQDNERGGARFVVSLPNVAAPAAAPRT